MTDQKHTPTPLHVTVSLEWFDKAIHRYNTHDALVEALEEADKIITKSERAFHKGYYITTSRSEWLKKCKEALKLAKEGQQ